MARCECYKICNKLYIYIYIYIYYVANIDVYIFIN